MIWVQHDFYSNFTGSVTSGDTGMTLSIFKSELSDLIVYNIDKLFELFDKVGVKYKKTETDEQIVDKVLNEININAKFVKGLAFLISDSNDVIKKNKDKSWTAILNKVSGVIKKISDCFAKNPKSKQLFQKSILEMIATKSSKVGNRNRQIQNKDYTVYWIVGIVVVGIGSYLLWEYSQKRKLKRIEAMKSGVFGSGGAVSKEITPEIPTPEQAIQPVATAPVVPPKPINNDPAFNVSHDVLIPEVPSNPAQTTVVVNTGTNQGANQTPINQVSPNLSS